MESLNSQHRTPSTSAQFVIRQSFTKRHELITKTKKLMNAGSTFKCYFVQKSTGNNKATQASKLPQSKKPTNSTEKLARTKKAAIRREVTSLIKQKKTMPDLDPVSPLWFEIEVAPPQSSIDCIALRHSAWLHDKTFDGSSLSTPRKLQQHPTSLLSIQAHTQQHLQHPLQGMKRLTTCLRIKPLQLCSPTPTR